MAKQIELPNLHLPEQQKPDKSSFDIRPAKLEQWVESLPMGNVGETARQVYQALRELNRLKHPWSDRLNFLETLRAPLNFVLLELNRRFVGVVFPLSEKVSQQAKLSQALCREVALGYTEVAAAQIDKSFLNRDKKALRTAIHRATTYLSHVLLTGYQTYAPQPEGVWQQLHGLYLHAEEMGVLRDPVSDPLHTEHEKTSISRIYKRILMLAMASPYRLRQGEAVNVFKALGRWSAHAEVLPYDSPHAQDALFVIHLDSDDEPDYRAFDLRDCDNSLCRLVTTQQLAKEVSRELEHSHNHQLHDALKGFNLSPDLLQRLAGAWALQPHRGSHRTNIRAKVEVVAGLTFIHHVLDNGHSHLDAHVAHYESHAVKAVAAKAKRPKVKDAWKLFNPTEVPEKYLHHSTPPPAEPVAEPEEEQISATIHTWEVRNESSGGFRLAIPNDNSAQIQVGELFALRSPNQPNKWVVGVARWLRHNTQGELELGVHVIAPSATALAAKHSAKQAEPQRALLLPAMPKLKQDATVILPVKLFKSGDMVVIGSDTGQTEVELGDIKEQSGSFVRYAFSQHDESQRDPATTENTTDNDEFEQLWSEL